METSSGSQSDPAHPILPVIVGDSDGPSRGRRRRRVEYPTVDGALGLSLEDSVGQARKFFNFGFLLLPWLLLLLASSDQALFLQPSAPPLLHMWVFVFHRTDVVGSAIGFLVFSALLSSWALTFAIGGEKLFGHVWDELVMYNLADRFGLTGWI